MSTLTIPGLVVSTSICLAAAFPLVTDPAANLCVWALSMLLFMWVVIAAHRRGAQQSRLQRLLTATCIATWSATVVNFAISAVLDNEPYTIVSTCVLDFVAKAAYATVIMSTNDGACARSALFRVSQLEQIIEFTVESSDSIMLTRQSSMDITTLVTCMRHGVRR